MEKWDGSKPPTQELFAKFVLERDVFYGMKLVVLMDVFLRGIWKNDKLEVMFLFCFRWPLLKWFQQFADTQYTGYTAVFIYILIYIFIHTYIRFATQMYMHIYIRPLHDPDVGQNMVNTTSSR